VPPDRILRLSGGSQRSQGACLGSRSTWIWAVGVPTPSLLPGDTGKTGRHGTPNKSQVNGPDETSWTNQREHLDLRGHQARFVG
jgi:hypothetical protein